MSRQNLASLIQAIQVRKYAHLLPEIFIQLRHVPVLPVHKSSNGAKCVEELMLMLANEALGIPPSSWPHLNYITFTVFCVHYLAGVYLSRTARAYLA